jgi:exonuclease VII large subunit
MDDSAGAHFAKGFAAMVPNVDPTDQASCQSLAALQANIQAQLTNWANSYNEHVRTQQAQHQAQQQMQQQNQIAATIQAAQAAAAAQMASQTAVQEESAARSPQPPPPPPPEAPAADGARGPLETAARMAPQERWASISAAGGTVAGLARTGRIAPAIKETLKKKAATRTQRVSKKGQEEDDLLRTLEEAANAEMPVDIDSDEEPAGTAGAAGASAGSDGSGL